MRQRSPESFNLAWGTNPIAGMRLRLEYEFPTVQVMHVYEVRSRKDKRGADLISDNCLLFNPAHEKAATAKRC